MAMYEPLEQHLRHNGASHIPMSFSEVESVLGRKLPASAYRHRPWWANEERGHSHAKAWLRAGYQTEHVDMAARKLVFVRRGGVSKARSESRTELANADKSDRHPLIGFLKGTFTIEPGWDLTKPTLDEGGLREMGAGIDRLAELIEQGLSKKRQ